MGVYFWKVVAGLGWLATAVMAVFIPALFAFGFLIVTTFVAMLLNDSDYATYSWVDVVINLAMLGILLPFLIVVLVVWMLACWAWDSVPKHQLPEPNVSVQAGEFGRLPEDNLPATTAQPNLKFFARAAVLFCATVLLLALCAVCVFVLALVNRHLQTDLNLAAHGPGSGSGSAFSPPVVTWNVLGVFGWLAITLLLMVGVTVGWIIVHDSYLETFWTPLFGARTTPDVPVPPADPQTSAA
jgi:hypothetical protein